MISTDYDIECDCFSMISQSVNSENLSTVAGLYLREEIKASYGRCRDVDVRDVDET